MIREHCPHTTMFMLSSVDGKSSTGADDAIFDFDKDLPKLLHARKGLYQYYNIEASGPLWTLCSGKTQHKVLADVELEDVSQCQANICVVDNHSLDSRDIQKLSRKFKNVVLASSVHKELDAPANVSVCYIDAPTYDHLLKNTLDLLYCVYHVTELCVQGGGSLNERMLRNKLIDEVDFVIAPLIVGGADTPSVVSGLNPVSLSSLCELQLRDVATLDGGYVRLRYNVLN